MLSPVLPERAPVRRGGCPLHGPVTESLWHESDTRKHSHSSYSEASLDRLLFQGRRLSIRIICFKRLNHF